MNYLLIALKSIAVYAFIVAAIRLFGKKELSQLSGIACVESIEKVDLAVLEVDGNISVLSNDYAHRTSRKRKVHKFLSKNE